MAIRYSNSGSASPSLIQGELFGDGTSTEISINLRKPPFDRNFTGNIPAGIERSTFINNTNITASFSLDNSVLTVTCDSPLGENQSASFSCVLGFEGI